MKYFLRRFYLWTAKVQFLLCVLCSWDRPTILCVSINTEMAVKVYIRRFIQTFMMENDEYTSQKGVFIHKPNGPQ